MDEYAEEFVFDHHSREDRDAVLRGFEYLLTEMRESHEDSERNEDAMATVDEVWKSRNERAAVVSQVGGPVNFELTEADLSEELDEVVTEMLVYSGARIKLADEVRALQTEFEGTGPVSEEVIERAMVLFRQQALRAALVMVSPDCENYEVTTKRVFIYANAYAALSTAAMHSVHWYPFNEYFL